MTNYPNSSTPRDPNGRFMKSGEEKKWLPFGDWRLGVFFSLLLFLAFVLLLPLIQ